MSFLAPGWMLVAGIASAVVAAIHLISWQLPRAVSLPTARFVPDEPARRAARTIRPSDLVLLALRIAILMSAGLALARPEFRPKPSGTARVIAVERSVDTTALRNAIASIPRGEQRVFVVFDTTARIATDETEVVSAATDSAAASSLSVGLLAAVREARALGRDYETVGITLVATFSRKSFDAATARVRAMWPDSIGVARIPLAQSSALAAGVQVDGDVDDPIVAGIRLVQANGLVHGPVRVSRVGDGDSTFAITGAVGVRWPRAESADGQRIDAVHTSDATAVGHFIRTASNDSGHVVARWVDGRPAATERRVGDGCIRSIGFDVPDVGDFTLTPAFQRLAAELLAPCVGNQTRVVASDSLIATIANPPLVLADVPDEDGSSSRLAVALMVLAVLLSLAELMVRRRSPARRVMEAAT